MFLDYPFELDKFREKLVNIYIFPSTFEVRNLVDLNRESVAIFKSLGGNHMLTFSGSVTHMYGLVYVILFGFRLDSLTVAYDDMTRFKSRCV